MRKFVILVNAPSTQQQNALSKFLQGTPCGYWHYLSDAWLVVDSRPASTAASWRDEIQTLLPGKNILVFSVTVEDWAGNMPKKNFEWLQKSW